MTTEEAPWALAPKWFNELNVFKLVRHVADFVELSWSAESKVKPTLTWGRAWRSSGQLPRGGSFELTSAWLH